MNCDQARNLFDAYLDGELSPTMATELSSHRLHCEECRRALALMEVVEQVVRCDDDAEPIGLCDGFTDRLLACIEPPASQRMKSGMRRWVTWGMPLTAAAMLGVVILYPVRKPESHHVLGAEEEGEPLPAMTKASSQDGVPDVDTVQASWQRWLQDLQDQWDADRAGGQHLRRAIESTAKQWILPEDVTKESAHSSVEREDGSATSENSTVESVEPMNR